MVGMEKPRSSAVELKEWRKPWLVIPGTSLADIFCSQRVRPVWCFLSFVIDGKTYFEFDLAEAAFRTAITADPTGRMLLPVLLSPRRRAIPMGSTSVFSN